MSLSKLRPLSIVACVLIAILAVNAGAESPIVPFKKNGDFIKSWLVCGPFPLIKDATENMESYHLEGFYTDYLAEHGGELNPTIYEGQTENYPGGSAVWKRVIAEDNQVNLDEAVTKANKVCAYAFCIIECTQAEACVLSIGSNDGVRAWLNGEQILDQPGPHGLFVDDEIIPVVLKQGPNNLLLKIEERGNAWSFCCRALPFTHPRVNEQIELFRVTNDAEGKAIARFIHNQSLMNQAIKEAAMEVYSEEIPGKPVWTSLWNGEREIQIPLDHNRFGQYHMIVKTTFVGGASKEMRLPFTVGVKKEHFLFEAGKSNYVIALTSEPSSSEVWAAKELQHWIKEAGGIELPILPESQAAGQPAIYVGLGSTAQKILGSEVKIQSVTDESFTYRNIGKDIFIWGGKQRGTQNGVVAFLENELGVRWYTPKVSSAPSREKYSFYHLFRTETPGVRVRNDFYYEAFEPIWAARNRVNGSMSLREQPGGVEAYWGVHTFFPLAPPEEFFATHPEYYSLIDGVRVYDKAQLCLTNPEVLEIITERLKKIMREQPGYLIYDVSQNDWAGPCQCEKCSAIAMAEESEAGPVIQFVNQVAERIEKEFPDKFVGTLAYQYTRKPCKTLKPRQNVVVRLCSIECCFSHDFLGCDENKSFVEDLTRWAEIAPHLYIWDYVVNFSHYIMPYPNFNVLKPNIQMFQKNNAIGIMEQAAYQSRGGEFAELRSYVIAKLLWNPLADVDELVNDFMYGYYGRAGQYVRAYFDLLHGRVTPDRHIHLGLKPDDPLFSDAFVQESLDLFRKARLVADNDEIAQRVDMASLPILYLKCRRTPEIAVGAGDYAKFREIVKREGITHYSESGETLIQEFHHAMEHVKQ